MGISQLEFDYSPLGRRPSFSLLLLVLFSIASSLSILANLVGTDGGRARITSTHVNTGSSMMKVEELEHSVLPQCSQKETHVTKFNAVPEFEGWGADVTRTWRDMLPNNNGLGQDDSFNDGKPYGIAMFHQIHCLHVIREYYTLLLEGPGVSKEDIQHVKSAAEQGHISHCFNWAILCHADDTREIQVHLPGGKTMDNTTRICGNTDVLWEATKNPKATNDY